MQGTMLKAKGSLESDAHLTSLRLSPSKKMLSFPNDNTPVGHVGRLEIIQHHSSSKELLKTS